jgi:hypothetical protein
LYWLWNMWWKDFKRGLGWRIKRNEKRKRDGIEGMVLNDFNSHPFSPTWAATSALRIVPMNVIFGIIRLTYVFTRSAQYKQWLQANPHPSPGFLYFTLPYFRKGGEGDGKEEDEERFRYHPPFYRNLQFKLGWRNSGNSQGRFMCAYPLGGGGGLTSMLYYITRLVGHCEGL